MAFTKAAVLIEASDVKGQLPIPGARMDVDHWNRYLRSNIGGVWSQIDIGRKPPKKDLVARLRALSLLNDYVFVAFSGHGYHDAATDRTVVLLNDTEEMEVTEFQPPCRSTVVVDACRGIETGFALRAESVRLTALSAMNESVKKAAFPQPTARDYALLFEQAVMRESGAGILYSCSVGEAADEDPNSGGVYTAALIGVAVTWHNGNQSLTPSMLSTSQAHASAKVLLAARQADQVPQAFFGGSSRNFPFAVRP